LAARAQQGERMRSVGVLTPFAAHNTEGQNRVTAFAQALQQLGWSVGQNARLHYRWGDGTSATIQKYAAELAAHGPDVILADSSAALSPLLQATQTIPIVFAIVADPVGAGYVETLARPRGNATGFTPFEYGVAGKWLELLKEIAPRVTRAAIPSRSRHRGRTWSVRRPPGRGALARRRAACRQRAGCRRDRAFHRGIRAGLKWWPRCHGQCGGGRASRSDRYAGRSAPIARGLQRASLWRNRRSRLLWSGFPRSVPPRRRLRGSHPQGREAGRSSGAGADQVRVGYQSQDRQGARP